MADPAFGSHLSDWPTNPSSQHCHFDFEGRLNSSRAATIDGARS
jgi:hypothetical protein